MKIYKYYLLFFCIFCFSPYPNAMSNEEAPYDIIDKNELYEIREYSDRLAVETIALGSENNFRKLFNYISGRNETNEKISMTTPVTQIEKEAGMSMQFYLPSKFNLNNAPNPTREDVNLITVEGGYYAVIRYSGRASDQSFVKHMKILEKELQNNNIKILSLPIRATYDSPFTLPMNRRNEVMFKIKLN